MRRSGVAAAIYTCAAWRWGELRYSARHRDRGAVGRVVEVVKYNLPVDFLRARRSASTGCFPCPIADQAPGTISFPDYRLQYTNATGTRAEQKAHTSRYSEYILPNRADVTDPFIHPKHLPQPATVLSAAGTIHVG